MNDNKVFTTGLLTKSAIKMFVRNKQAVFFTLFMPLIIMTVFGFIGFDKPPVIDIGMALNAPPTPDTKQIVETIKKVESFKIHVGTEANEIEALEKGDRVAVFLIPFDLVTENIGSSIGDNKGTVTVLTNASQGQQAGTAISILNQILYQTNFGITGSLQLFAVETHEVNSLNLKYIDFLLPGIVALSLMQMSVFSVAFVFVDYKEKGILKRLLATPMKPYQFVTANIITRLIVALVQTAILVAVGLLLFKAHMLGSYWLLFIVALLGAIMFLGLGFTISGIAKTVEAVPAVANLIVFPMLFLGGTFFPISTMPDWLQGIVKYLPLTYLSNSLREIMTKDASFSMIQSDVIWMVVWSIVLIILANFTFGFEEKRV